YKFLSLFSKYKFIYEEVSRDNLLLDGSFCSDDTHTIQIYNGKECFDYKSVCPKFIKYMIKIKEKYGKITPESYKYLYYWMHQNFLTFKGNDCNAFAFYKILLNNYCKNGNWEQWKTHISEMKYDEFERHNNLMHLYDIFHNFITPKDKEENIKCIKANECVKQYDEYIEPCFGGVRSNYCDELKNFKEDYEKLIAELTCENITRILTSPEGISKAYITTISVVTILIVPIILYFLYK
ncbi:hypothetical protein PVNG_05616, partial [Plasmodium vivax North Korean]